MHAVVVAFLRNASFIFCIFSTERFIPDTAARIELETNELKGIHCIIDQETCEVLSPLGGEGAVVPDFAGRVHR